MSFDVPAALWSFVAGFLTFGIFIGYVCLLMGFGAGMFHRTLTAKSL